MSGPILFAYAFDGKGGASALTGAAVSDNIKADNIAWVHLDANHPDTAEWLRRETGYLDPLITDALLAEETSPRFTEVGGGALLFLRGVNLDVSSAPEDMVSLRLWVDKHRIISVRKRRLKAIREIESALLDGRGPTNAGDFAADLVSRMFNRFEPVLAALDDATDEIEAAALDAATGHHREDIVRVRKQAIVFKRYMTPQRDAIAQLYASEISWLNKINRRSLQESYSRVKRYVDDLDAIRERAQVVKDELATILSDRLNKNTYVLSVIAAIFLPLGFLTGLLGINVGGIPGADNDLAFWAFVGMLAVIVGVQIAVFRFLKWF